jgi:O-antigen/teichoic acid export membrane protein
MSDDQHTADKPTSDQQTARTAGRGFLIITAAKVWFLITGAVTQLGLPILFGEAQLFGVFKIVTEAISLINMVMITGTLQAVTKLVSERPDQARQTLTQALRLQLGLGLPAFLLYAGAAPFIAGDIFHDPALTGYIRLSSLIIVAYAFYATFVGYLNGMKLFVQQAALDIAFQTMKTVAMLGLVVAGAGVAGAVGGFVGAAVTIALISAVWTWRLMGKYSPNTAATPQQAEQTHGEGGDEASVARGRLLGFLLSVMLYTFALNALMRTDLFMIKSIGSATPEAHAAWSSVLGQVSDKFAGFYGAALNLARLPYQGVIAITFIILPMISEATFQQDKERTRAYITGTFRYCMILICGLALPLIFNADSVIAALYSPDYRAAADGLAILSMSSITFSLLYVAATMITGAGRPLVSVAIMAFSLAVGAGTGWALLQGVHAQVMAQLVWPPHTPAAVPAGLDASATVWAAKDAALPHATLAAHYLKAAPDYMRAAAWATASAMTMGSAAAILWLGRTWGAWPPLKTMLRLCVAALLLWGMDQVIPLPVEWVAQYGKIQYLALVTGKMVVMGLGIGAVLAVLGEVSAADRERFGAVVGRRFKRKAVAHKEN